MKECELCNFPARMYCESDKASLCWDCDEKIHSANFLVARHSRCLLCHVCQSPTTWTASGLKLGHTVSVCEKCVTSCRREDQTFIVDEQEDDESHGESDEDEDEDEDEEEEDGDNQVVPWTSTPPPPVMSPSSSEGESSSRIGDPVLKRRREDADLDSDDEIGCSAFPSKITKISTTLTLGVSGHTEATSFASIRTSKLTRTAEESSHTSTIQGVHHEETKSNHIAFINSLKRFQQSSVSGDNVLDAIIGIQKLSRDPRSLHLDLQ